MCVKLNTQHWIKSGEFWSKSALQREKTNSTYFHIVNPYLLISNISYVEKRHLKTKTIHHSPVKKTEYIR